ncbi:MAG: proteasome accessory factor PafA2 family protein [Chthoniobacterales bacterium]
MDRIVGIEIEYGCLATGPLAASWPARVRNFLFAERQRGLIDQHYRDYEEPPGNGGFLFNGGRLYLDMGHLEYATAECLDLHDLVAHELAGDQLILEALQCLSEMEPDSDVSFLKNNIDHFTDATFGCHENYLMQRDALLPTVPSEPSSPSSPPGKSSPAADASAAPPHNSTPTPRSPSSPRSSR